MTVQAWLNGDLIADPEHALAITNRGLHYGDGVFETMHLLDGQIRFLDAHIERATEGCARLGIELSTARLLQELSRLPLQKQASIVKLVLVRSGAGRGYRPAPHGAAMRLILLYPWTEAGSTVRAQWCSTRWSRNPQLAGLKHLNRLEQVLAQRELRESVDEGLMLDTEGEVVSATSGNVFVVREGKLCTPDLRLCGVSGVMRRQVIGAARAIGHGVDECVLRPADIEGADEAFITNALRGIRPIVQLDAHRWQIGPIAHQLQRTLML
ncbi:MAG: aminodeoxychorismate lyase [Steroidobacteraceae bacterium]